MRRLFAPPLLVLVVALGVAGVLVATPSTGLILDRGGKKTEFGFADYCSNFQVVKAIKEDAGDRSYVFKGGCGGFEGLPNIQFEVAAKFKWLSGYGRASEAVKVTGGATGQANSSIEPCEKDPFVHGIGVCTGAGLFSASQMLYDAMILAKQFPLFAGRVPSNQAYTTPGSSPGPPCPPGDKNQVRIVKPTENQVFPTVPASFLVEFGAQCAQGLPEGGVRLQWQRRQPAGSWATLPDEVQHVPHYTMGQQVGIDLKGYYRFRATARPDLQWGSWRHFWVGMPSLDPKMKVPQGTGSPPQP